MRQRGSSATRQVVITLKFPRKEERKKGKGTEGKSEKKEKEGKKGRKGKGRKKERKEKGKSEVEYWEGRRKSVRGK